MLLQEQVSLWMDNGLQNQGRPTHDGDWRGKKGAEKSAHSRFDATSGPTLGREVGTR